MLSLTLYQVVKNRKLSVGIAMVGDSRLILLDEPTNGMDYPTKTKVWDMLIKNKQNRIIILTTNSMHEANALGDRLAIITDGKIR